MLPELRLVRDEDRPIVPCPAPLRGDFRRALLAKFDELEQEVVRCKRRALEGGYEFSAASLDATRPLIRQAIASVTESR